MSTETTSGGIVAYKNLNTNEIHLSDGPHPDLDARPNMQRVGLDEVPPSALAAAQRAQAERGSIDEAAGDRARGGFHDRGSGPVMATAAHYQDPGVNDSTGILSRPGMRPGGPHPEALLAQAEQDRMYPDRRGVIERGEQPAPTASGELLSQPVTVAESEPAGGVDVTVTDDGDGDGGDPDGGDQGDSQVDGDGTGEQGVDDAKAEAKTPARKSTRAKA